MKDSTEFRNQVDEINEEMVALEEELEALKS